MSSDLRCAICTKTWDEHKTVITHDFKHDPRPSNEEVESLRAQLAEWQRWTKGHVWIRNEEYAELCELKRLHGPKPPSLPVETAGDDTEDMANIGRALMERLPKDYHWNDCPTEIVTDLLNQIHDLKQATPGACCQLGEDTKGVEHDLDCSAVEPSGDKGNAT